MSEIAIKPKIMPSQENKTKKRKRDVGNISIDVEKQAEFSEKVTSLSSKVAGPIYRPKLRPGNSRP